MRPTTRSFLGTIAVFGVIFNAVHYVLFALRWMWRGELEYEHGHWNHVEFLGHEIAGLLWLWFFVWLQAEAPSARGEEKGESR